MTFWCGSGSADPCPDPDPNPAIFITDLQDANKNKFFEKNFPASYFLTEGSGSIPLTTVMDPDPDPGGPKTCGSGTGFRSGSATLIKTYRYTKKFSLFPPNFMYSDLGPAVENVQHELGGILLGRLLVASSTLHPGSIPQCHLKKM
jgi:hypothetical protein